MKKKTIIITALSALLLAGAAVGAVYALDIGIASEAVTSDKPAVLVKDDPSIVVDISGEMIEGAYYHESQITYLTEHARVRSVIDEAVADALAENPGIENIGIGEDECMDMTKEQIKLYVDLIVKKGNEMNGELFGSYRLLAQAKGEISLDVPRLTVEALDEIISQSADISEMSDKLHEQYGGPDYLRKFSGFCRSIGKYWLNDNDESKYICFSYDCGTHTISLYDGENVTVLYTNDDLKALFGKE